MDLCDSCLGLVQRMAAPFRDDEYGFRKIEIKKLPSPDGGCQLCQEFCHALQYPFPEVPGLYVQVECRASAIQNERGLCCEAKVSLLENKGYGYRRAPRFADYALWADIGAAAGETLVTRSPFLWSIRDFSGLARGWLDDCLLNHGPCVAGHLPRLPNRVIQILDGPNDTPRLKLLETKGEKAQYLALSHCWGSVDKAPPKTTKANLEQQLLDIPFRKLPKTFREAILFTKGIGYEFIWIDSLCIIQNDTQDWRREAKGMGAIYHDATLVICAAGALNSSEGLLTTERPRSMVFKPPYIINGVAKGHFNMTAVSIPSDYDPSLGPLYIRGWALQEWYLARRLLFFMLQGISWRCNQFDLSERGTRTDLRIPERECWTTLLGRYSFKALTFPSDRLHALRGIVRHLKLRGRRQDEYFFEYGVWQDGLIEQILWRQWWPLRDEDSLELPSWSWAATGGPKIWIYNITNPPSGSLTKRAMVSSSGSLRISGNIAAPSFFLSRTPDSSKFLVDVNQEVQVVEQYMFTRDDFGFLPSYIIWDGSLKKRIFGLAAFDRDPVAHAQFFLVASSKRKDCPRGPSFNLEDSTEPALNATVVENGEDLNIPDGEVETTEPASPTNPEDLHDDPKMETDVSDGTVRKLVHQIRTTKYVYWALLLEPVGDGKFKRVGIACLYPNAYEAYKKKPVEVEIV